LNSETQKLRNPETQKPRNNTTMTKLNSLIKVAMGEAGDAAFAGENLV